MSDKKRIALIGCTGSIGTQTLEVIEQHSDKFELSLLSANNNADLLIEQALKFAPNTVVIANEEHYKRVEEILWKEDIKTFAGPKALEDAVQMDEIDLVVAAIVGFAGLMPVIKAIEAGKNIALANKETLVVAGEIITKLAREKGVNIYPIDSEHSAIFQCLSGEFENKIDKIILTASGGPFRGYTSEQLKAVTKKQALNHPNWEMGEKITIDSATMMNKGLEVIEAKWLFALKPEQIEVLVHPESIIHSMVEFEDGAIKAQMGLPDMKLPIQYALSYPKRLKSNFKRLSFSDYSSFTFESVDMNVFPCLQLGYSAIEKGGNIPAALNAANEEAVSQFLSDRIEFHQISEINAHVLSKVDFIKQSNLDDLIETDRLARLLAQEF